MYRLHKICYRLVEIITLYPKYLTYFYTKHPDSLLKSYSDHINDIFNDCFAESNFIHSELHNIGIESTPLIYNAEALQKSWDSQYNNLSLFEILIKQLLSLNPDVILFSDMTCFSGEMIKKIKDVLPHHIKLVGFHFTIITNSFIEISNSFDQIYTGSKYHQNLLKTYCKDVKLLRHAFNPAILDKLNPNFSTANSIIFPGSIMPNKDIHYNRINILGKLLEKNYPLSLYGEFYGSNYDNMYSKIKRKIKKLLQRESDDDKYKNILRGAIKPSVFGLEYFNKIKECLCCLNIHAEIAGTGCGNIRMFEATGIGSCLITDERAENKELFRIDTEIIVYRNFEDLFDKIDWLLNNIEKLKEIAKAGQERTIKNYNYNLKANLLNEYISKLF